jgi:glyoxylase-like metal-dependent hydrolase (beta-lactamase superfamily II)
MSAIMPGASLPPSIRVIVRGWLNCNQVVLRAPGDNVLIDSGYCTHREETLLLVAGERGLAGEPLERLINTHCHSDHMGGNAAVASAHGCRITIPRGEVKHVVPWTPQSVWMAQFDQRADPFHFDDTLEPGDTFEAGGFEWEAYAAPGHDMDALVFFEPVNRVLISGDALWQDGMGFVWPEEGANPYIDAAHSALSTIERLAPAVVIPGHGVPFDDVATSVASVRSKLDAFARDPGKNARHVVKVMFVFALLDRGSMPVAELPAYLERVPCYGMLSERFLGTAPKAMASWIVEDLQRAGAVVIRDAVMRPTARA